MPVFFIGLIVLLSSLCTASAFAVERIAPPLEQLVAGYTAVPSMPAQILLRKTQVAVDANYFAESHAYVAISINSEEAARDYSQMSLNFNSFYESLELEFASVRTPDGALHNMEKDAVQIQSPAEENFYQDTKQLTFSLPNVQVGSVIEFQYKRKDVKKIIPKVWFESFWLNWWEERAANQGPRVDSVLNAIFEVRAPADLRLFSHATKAVTSAPTKTRDGNQQVFTWRQQNLPAMELQNNMPRGLAVFPVVQMSSMNSWQQVAQWGVDTMSPHMNIDERLQGAVATIKTRSNNNNERVKQTYQFLQDKVRYVFAHVGRGGYEPHSATEVLNNGYGDCKDQTILAVTLLRQLGIEAYPALVATRSRGMPDTASVAVNFDHMITYIPPQKDVAETWLDTSGETSLFPGFSTGIEGQAALVVKPTTDKLVLIKQRTAQEHAVHLRMVFDKATPQSVEAQFTLTLSGQFEETLRSGWLFAPEKQKMLADLLGNLYAAGELTQLTTQNANNLWEPFSVTGRFIFKNGWAGEQKNLNYAFSLEQPLVVFSDILHLHKPVERKQDYVIDPGYSILADVIFIPPASDYELVVSSRGGNYKNQWFDIEQSGKQEGKNYHLQQKFVLHKATIPLSTYPRFFAAVKNVLDAPAWQVIYTPKLPSGSMSKNAGSTGPAQVQLEQVRQLLDRGDYAQALTMSQQVIIAAPKSGEAYYLLGLAQGYQDQVDAANKSFSQAKELGYSP